MMIVRRAPSMKRTVIFVLILTLPAGTALLAWHRARAAAHHAHHLMPSASLDETVYGVNGRRTPTNHHSLNEAAAPRRGRRAPDVSRQRGGGAASPVKHFASDSVS